MSERITLVLNQGQFCLSGNVWGSVCLSQLNVVLPTFRGQEFRETSYGVSPHYANRGRFRNPG